MISVYCVSFEVVEYANKVLQSASSHDSKGHLCSLREESAEPRRYIYRRYTLNKGRQAVVTGQWQRWASWSVAVQRAHLDPFFCGLCAERFLDGLRWLSVEGCSRIFNSKAFLSNCRVVRILRSALAASSVFHNPNSSYPRSHAYKYISGI